MPSNVLFGEEREVGDLGLLDAGKPECLGAREWYVLDGRIRLRLGLETIAADVGVSRERIRQVAASGCLKLLAQYAEGRIKSDRRCRLCGDPPRPTFVLIHGWSVCGHCVQDLTAGPMQEQGG